FQFEPVWAMMMPVEKILAYADHAPESVSLTQEDRQLIDNLALPLGKALVAAKTQESRSCTLQDDQMTLDHTGKVSLCCGVYVGKYNLASYLERSLEELQALKYKQDICKTCMSCGVPVYITYAIPELDRLAADNVDPKHAKLLGLRYERLWKRIKYGVRVTRNALRQLIR